MKKRFIYSEYIIETHENIVFLKLTPDKVFQIYRVCYDDENRETNPDRERQTNTSVRRLYNIIAFE